VLFDAIPDNTTDFEDYLTHLTQRDEQAATHLTFEMRIVMHLGCSRFKNHQSMID
jgi:hypothetical protein